jgi:hypothetical protein
LITTAAAIRTVKVLGSISYFVTKITRPTIKVAAVKINVKTVHLERSWHVISFQSLSMTVYEPSIKDFTIYL